MEKNKRNTLTVRLNDADWESFKKTYALKYSTTLRELVNVYASNFQIEDLELPVSERVRRIMTRYADRP